MYLSRLHLRNWRNFADQVVEFNKAYLGWRGTQLANKLRGIKYQVHGPAARGDAAPEMPAQEEAPAAE